MTTCPQCLGFGVLVAAFKPVSLPCDLCGGGGEVEDGKLRWRKLGAILKGRRIAARLGLREAARMVGIDASNLSKMERGCIAPKPIKYL